MIERISPPSSSPSDKERKKIPDSGRFQEEMRIEKTGEIEFEKQKKRFFRPEEEEEPIEEPTPYEPTFFERAQQAVAPTQKEELPESPNFYKKVDLHESTLLPPKNRGEETPQSLQKKEEKQKEKKGVQQEKKEEKIPYEALSLKKEKKGPLEKKSPLLSKEESEKIIEQLPTKEKKEFEKAPFPPKKEETKTPFERTIKEEKPPFFQPRTAKTKEEKISMPRSLTPQLEKELEKAKKKEGEKEKPAEGKKSALTQTKEAAATAQELPASVQSEASASVAAIAPYVKAENLPLFERMVGTIIQMTKLGVEKSEILLTSPTFVGSKYYGTRIIFEKYSTAPDSFNIHLTGSDEAVTTFNENLEGLMRAFDLGSFSFRVGRLWAEYEVERPLFKRKPTIGEEGKERGKEK